MKTLGNIYSETADLYITIGMAYKNKKDYDNAIENLSNGLQIYSKTQGNTHP